MHAHVSRRVPSRLFVAAISGALLASAAAGCGGEERKYVPKPAFSGKKADLPQVPTLPQKAKKVGDAYTVWGVTHDLRSRVHRPEVNGKKLSIVGYVVRTNLVECKDDSKALTENCAPKCAVHKTGKADPPDCKAPVPTFWIADTKEGEPKQVIEVMGWASNFANLYDAIEEVDKTPKDKQAELKIEDPFWGVAIPNPLPAVGQKVKVTGQYGVTFAKASSGVAANPKMGIMTAETVEVLEPAAELANLPGMKPRKKQ
jgi:hypothetical protein